MNNTLIIMAACVLGSYLVGSVSSAIVVCRLFRLPDPRLAGSHNPGATNVLRLGGKLPAALALFGDLLKGFLPVWAANYWDGEPWFVSAVFFAAVMGHLFPVFFGFKGGKGVATFLGDHWIVSHFRGNFCAYLVWDLCDMPLFVTLCHYCNSDDACMGLLRIRP